MKRLNVKQLIKRFLSAAEPPAVKKGNPEDLLRAGGCPDAWIQSFEGRRCCLLIAVAQMKRAFWEAVFPGEDKGKEQDDACG